MAIKFNSVLSYLAENVSDEALFTSSLSCLADNFFFLPGYVFRSIQRIRNSMYELFSNPRS